MNKIVCLDFDGVCNKYDGWKGEDELFEPREGLEDFINKLIVEKKRVAVFSTRPALKLEAWFIRWFPYSLELIHKGDLFFPTRKPPAECYVDDRAVRFNGSFNDILQVVLNFKAFWEIKSLQEAVINHSDCSNINIDSKGVIR